MIEVVKGDITKIPVDAIVNAANSSLMGGGGVDGAIHRAGGPAILEECKKVIAKIGRCDTGNAVITTAGNLPAKFVIHTVGPVWHGNTGGKHQQLRDCYLNSLELAEQNNCKTIAFPNISTGIYGFPKDEAASVAVKTVLEYTAGRDTFQKVIFVCHEDDNFNLIKEELERHQNSSKG